jgi:catechol 2,3-dioxygenase-like lactoylglutathione lyase family enzyme
MARLKLAHYAVRARDLEASRRFYEAVLQLRAGPRPPFAFPGLWLYPEGDPEPGDQGLVHLIGDAAPEALKAYLGGGEGPPRPDTGPLDHIAFQAQDWPAQRARCHAAGVPYEERRVPALGLRQVFLKDPSGVTVELNFAEP